MTTMATQTQIKGIDNMRMGAALADNAYKINEDFYFEGKKFSLISDLPSKNYGIFEDAAQVKFLFREDTKTVFMCIAGTNSGSDVLSWPTIGKKFFLALDSDFLAARDYAEKNGFNLVLVGDSNGGLITHQFHHVYGVDGFTTNTGEIDRNFPQDKNRGTGVIYTINMDGEAVSKILYLPSVGETYLVPNPHGHSSRKNAGFIPEYSAHTNRKYLINYTGEIYTHDTFPLDFYPNTKDHYFESAQLIDNRFFQRQASLFSEYLLSSIALEEKEKYTLLIANNEYDTKKV